MYKYMILTQRDLRSSSNRVDFNFSASEIFFGPCKNRISNLIFWKLESHLPYGRSTMVDTIHRTLSDAEITPSTEVRTAPTAAVYCMS